MAPGCSLAFALSAALWTVETWIEERFRVGKCRGSYVEKQLVQSNISENKHCALLRTNEIGSVMFEEKYIVLWILCVNVNMLL